MPKINLKTKSPEFREFVEKLDDILSKTQHLTADGKSMDNTEQHFKDQVKRLATVRLEFEFAAPVYPINQWVASDLVWSEIQAIQDEEDIKAVVRVRDVQ
jgi:hypothetical protein|tara:strand:- start:1412 stop:1711 length:300 start_codon:yes stop_codon:yes gene_type:complete